MYMFLVFLWWCIGHVCVVTLVVCVVNAKANVREKALFEMSNTISLCD